MRDLLQLHTSSRVLIISTEGDTDPVTYRKIVWDGAFPSVDKAQFRGGDCPPSLGHEGDTLKTHWSG